MAVAFGTVATALDGVATITINVPASTADGDCLLMVVTSNDGAAVWTTPSGWTLIHAGADNVAAGASSAAYFRVAASEPASYTVTQSVSNSSVGAILRYTGADPLNPVESYTAVSIIAAGDPQLKQCPALTPNVNNCRVVGWISMDSANASGAQTWAPSTGTERVDIQETGNFNTITVLDVLQTTRTATTISSTYSLAGSNQCLAGSISLREPFDRPSLIVQQSGLRW